MSECIEKIERFIKKQGYTYKWIDVLEDYATYYKRGRYMAHSMSDCINNNLNECKYLYKYFDKRGRM